MNLQEFKPIYQAYKASGLSRRAFATANNFKGPKFNYWVNKLESENSDFIKVEVEPESSSEKYEVLLNSGASLFIPKDFDSLSLQRLLSVLN